MPQFTTPDGIKWKVNFTVGLLLDVEDSTGIDLNKLIEESTKFSEFLTQQPRKLVEMLYALCEGEIKERGINPRDFGRLFDRPTLDNATDAVIEAAVLFFPRLSAGQVISGRLPQILAKMDGDIRRQATERVDALLSSTPANSPESVG